MEILDIHTHHEPPVPDAVVTLDAVLLARKYNSADEVVLADNQYYSVGIHPWSTADEAVDEGIVMLRKLASRPRIVAIGEAGIDALHGAPAFKQILIFREHISLSEQYSKPLIIHDVKSHDVILGQYTDMQPRMPWCIHGFRAKPTVAEMFLAKGMYLSFGEKFNPETVRMMPADRILAETDESDKGINDIIKSISEVRGEDMTSAIAANADAFLGR